VIETAIGRERLYFRASNGVRCRTAYRVVRSYFRRGPEECVGSGCFISLPSHWQCSTASGTVTKRDGTVASCYRNHRRRRILTSRFRNKGFA
jgi:hypothetical protein